MNQREQLASENGMTIEFVNWFFDHKKDGCGNVWFVMMAAMWEGWNAREAQVKQLAAENAPQKSGTAYFSYGSEHNFEWHKTAELAVEAAELAIDDYRGEACDGWSEEVDSICWGVIMQSSTKVGERPRTEDDSCDPAIDTVCDYALLPTIETPNTEAFLSRLRAEGVEMFAKKCRDNSLREFGSDPYVHWKLSGDHAFQFAAQLREGKAGEVQS